MRVRYVLATLAALGAAVAAPALASGATIMEIQGTNHISPLANMTVSAEGIVTATRLVQAPRGFYLQGPVGDGNPVTSDGIFVFTSTAPTVAVGARVSVFGRVVENRAAAPNLTITQFDRPAITVLSTGNPVPAATTIPQPPTEVIENDATDVETTGVFDPQSDGIDFYETFEGMRVQVVDPVAVSRRNSFGETAVISDDWAAGLLSARGAIVVQPNDFNPERVIVDDENLRPGTTPPNDTGDRFGGPLVGVMDYTFGNFKLQLTAAPTVVDGGLQPETTRAPGSQELAVATFNVLNLAPIPADAAQTVALARQIVFDLKAPDLIALQEMQDASGEADDGVTAGAPTFQALVDAIVAVGGPEYEFRQIDPVNNQDGGAPGSNIRVGFLFHRERGLSFTDRPGGDATTPTEVIDHPSGPRLTLSPGRVDPQHPAWFTPEGTRKPLAGEFRFRGKRLFVIANHLKSKTGDDPLFGRVQPPRELSVPQRVAQAEIVRDFVNEILAVDPNAYVIVLGDFNDFHFSAALDTLEGGVLTNLTETIPANDRYTFVFDGNGQTLDHILVSPRIAQRRPLYDIVHNNIEFAEQASDHDAGIARINLIGLSRR